MDEFNFIAMAQEGVLKKSIFLYMQFEGSFLGHFVGLLPFLMPKLIFYIIFLVFAYFSTYFLISSIFNYLKISVLKIDVALMTSILLSVIYLISPTIPYLWHSINVVSSYNIVTFALFLGIALILRNYVYLSIPIFMFIMQSRIMYSVVVIGFFSLYYLYQWYSNKKTNKKLNILALFMIIALIIYVAAPSNYNHNKVARTFGMTDLSFYESMLLILKEHILTQIPLLILSSTALSLFINKEFIAKIKLKNIAMITPLVLLILSILVTSFVMYFATHKFYYAPRIWSLVSVLYIFVFLYYFLIAKNFIEEKFEHIRFFKPLLTSINVIAILYIQIIIYKTLKINYPIIKSYAQAYDKTDDLIFHSTIPDGDTLFFPSDGPSGVLMSGHSEQDSSVVRKYYGKKIFIRAQKEK